LSTEPARDAGELGLRIDVVHPACEMRLYVTAGRGALGDPADGMSHEGPRTPIRHHRPDPPEGAEQIVRRSGGRLDESEGAGPAFAINQNMLDTDGPPIKFSRGVQMVEILLKDNIAIWLGILLCVTLAGILSGLNLAVFSVSRLKLEVEAAGGNRDALRVLTLRKDVNFLLATIIWSNVAVNVFLTLLSDSVLTALQAFFFSTIAITLFGEIVPQAYFSRNAMHICARLAPMLNLLQAKLYPVAKPTAMILDRWLGPEGVALFRERDFRALMSKHVEEISTNVGRLEAIGALNFLDLDDVRARDEGELVDPRSIVSLPMENGRPVMPTFDCSPNDRFLRRLDASGRKWVIFVDDTGEPQMVLNAHHFLRDALFDEVSLGPEAYWHRPIVVKDPQTRLGDVIGMMKVKSARSEDDIIDHDLILVWGEQKRIITGADLLGRLLRGIATREVRR
jgi:metal transporter CNNM